MCGCCSCGDYWHGPRIVSRGLDNGARVIPVNSDFSDTVPGAMYRAIVDKWGEAQAEALHLRGMLADAGTPVPDPPGCMTLRRLRDYERLRFLAREYVYAPTDDRRAELLAAIAAAEVSP